MYMLSLPLSVGQWGRSGDFCRAWRAMTKVLSVSWWIHNSLLPIGDYLLYFWSFVSQMCTRKNNRTITWDKQPYLSLQWWFETADCGLRCWRPWCWACTRCTVWGTRSQRGRKPLYLLCRNHQSPGCVWCSEWRPPPRWTLLSRCCCPLASQCGWQTSRQGLKQSQNIHTVIFNCMG